VASEEAARPRSRRLIVAVLTSEFTGRPPAGLPRALGFARLSGPARPSLERAHRHRRNVMSKKDKKQKRKKQKQKKAERKRLAGCEHRSDKRTAEFLVRQIGAVQEDLGDLVAEFKAFGHYSEIQYAALCVRLMETLKKKYERFAESGVWPEDE
jgi:hypothetical protein